MNNRRDLLKGVGALVVSGAMPAAAQAQGTIKIKQIYPTRSGGSWPIWLALEGGYYRRHGLEVTPEFGVHPVGIAGLVSGEVQMTNYSFDDVAAAVVRDPVLVVMGTVLNKVSFALMAKPEFAKVEELKGKRIGVGRVGDPPYHYTSALLREYGLKSNDVQWVPTGTDANARAQMLTLGQIDAALLSSPSWFRLEPTGLKVLTLMEEHDNIAISTGYTFRKSWVAANPEIPERLLRAQGEAVHRFYTDKPFALETYRKYDKAVSEEHASRLYDTYVRNSVLDRVPLVLRRSVAASIDRLKADVPAVEGFDFQQAIDMRVVRKLIAEGFYDKLYGTSVQVEQDRKLKETFA